MSLEVRVEREEPHVVIGDQQRRLTLTDYHSSGYCTVALDVPGLHAITGLEFTQSEHGGSEQDLCSLFERMAVDWRGWTGERVWNGTADAIGLAFTHDGVGHVLMATTFVLAGVVGHVQTTIMIEPGGLSRLAAELRSFFHQSAA
jgi:hypothetical protein